MAITTPEKRQRHIRGLAVAAKKIQQEEQKRQQNDKDIEFNFGANLISKRPKKTRVQ